MGKRSKRNYRKMYISLEKLTLAVSRILQNKFPCLF